METEKQLKQTMAAVFSLEADAVTEQTSVDTVELWDSLNHMNLVASLEEAFKITLSTEEIIECTDYEAICRVLRRHGVWR